jgi:hypothetical protein
MLKFKAESALPVNGEGEGEGCESEGEGARQVKGEGVLLVKSEVALPGKAFTCKGKTGKSHLSALPVEAFQYPAGEREPLRTSSSASSSPVGLVG